MGISYDGTIPSVGGDPNIQYNTIRSNFASIQTFEDVNHVDFSEPEYGQHLKIDLPFVAAPASPSDLASVVFSKAGVVDSSASDLAFINKNATFVLNLIRAYVKFDNNGNILNGQNMNVVSVTKVMSINAVDIVFDPNAVIGTAFSVFVGVNINATYSYSVTAANTIRLSYSTATLISVIALQL